MTRPFVFISYSQEDEEEKNQLLEHLGVLQREGLIELWRDDQLGMGADWQTEIEQSIARAKVAILFVTANFLTSDFTLGQEVPALLQRREQEGLVILPVIAKPCAWQRVKWLARLVPEQSKQPIWRDSNSNVDDELADIAERVARIVNDEPLSDEPIDGKVRPKELRIGSFVIPLTPFPLAALGLLGVLALLFFLYPTFTSTPPAGPTPTLTLEQASLFRVALAEFGEKDSAGQVHPSPVGQQISQRIYKSLELEFENLPVELLQDFQPTVWHDTLNPLPTGRKIGLIADEKAAAALASEIGVDGIIYGNLEQGEAGASFVPQFYMVPLKGQAEEIIGEYRLGGPILLPEASVQNPQAELGLNKKLNERVSALAHFTLGLMYDLGGFHQDALKVFEQAVDKLDLTESNGQEVFYYFMGRSALFLKEDEAAQADFERALTSTQDQYSRAYIGLGSVYLLRAECRLFSATGRSGPEYDELCRRADGTYIAPCQLSPNECYTLSSEEAQQAFDHYQRVIKNSLESHIKNIARLSLGMAKHLQGQIARQQSADDQAEALFDNAILEISETLSPLEAQGQYRYLGQAYYSLGTAYAHQAQIRTGQGDNEGGITLYRKAREAFAECMAQQKQSAYDETLAQFVASCNSADKAISAILSGLQGESQ